MQNEIVLETSVKYSTFWKRFCAGVVDGVLLMAVVQIPISYLYPHSKWMALIPGLVGSFVYHFYDVYFHGKFGATIGKKALGLQLRKVDLSPIGFREALLRSSVGIFLSILTIVVYAIALNRADLVLVQQSHIALFEFFTNFEGVKAKGEAFQQFQKLMPFGGMTGTLASVWLYSEMITMLFNKKRRAIHDYIAGTVAIQVPKKN